MKKIIYMLIFIILTLLISYGIIKDIKNIKNKKENIEIDYNSVEYNGWLKTDGNKLLNSKDEIITLKGISSQGIQWFNDLYSYSTLKNLKEEWNINVFRIAMYTDPKKDGYIKNKNLKYDVYKIIDSAIELDMYVIIDWHILKDNNPSIYKDEAIDFFDEISKKYYDKPNVIYEICNEPNGNGVSWNEDIKPYALDVINKIRNNSPNSLVIVGIPNWCRDLRSPSKNVIELDNIIYSVHFYSGSEGQELRNEMLEFMKLDLPIFVSECGITDSSGDGKIYEDSFIEWVNFLDENKISWVYWGLSNKDETSSILYKDYIPKLEYLELGKYGEPIPIYTNINCSLSKSGKIIKKLFSN